MSSELADAVLAHGLVRADEPNEIARDISPELAAYVEASEALRDICSGMYLARISERSVYDRAAANLLAALKEEEAR
jgi:hypothetical protein